MDLDAEDRLLKRALARDADAIRALVDLLTPVIQTRVARELLGVGCMRAQKRCLRQEVADLTQEVFLSLFQRDARALRAWDPSRGALVGFVGLVAGHIVMSIVRSRRRSPWSEQAIAAADLERWGGKDDRLNDRIYSRELLVKVLNRLRGELSERDQLLFELVVLDDASVAVVTAQTGMTPGAVYTWRSRFANRVRLLAAELERGSDVKAKDGTHHD
jgi:DNA-directed RNA polymerase specialized sigma24 family protein